MDRFHDHDKSGHHKVFLLAFAGLLILRIAFIGFLSLFRVTWSWDWVEPVWQIGTYLLIAFMVWSELDHLADYHIDTLTVIAILVFTPFATLVLKYWKFDNNPLRFPGISSLIIWFIAVLFLIGLVKHRARLPKIRAASFAWIGFGMLIGIGTAMLLGFVNSFRFPAGQYFMGPLTLFSKTTLTEVAVTFVYQAGSVAALEEPVFRGFLWGYLLKLGWNERRILIFQVCLFTLAHMSGLRWFPLQFLVVVPVCSLIFGYLVWRSRTLTSSIAAHGIYNTSADIFGGLVAQYLR